MIIKKILLKFGTLVVILALLTTGFSFGQRLTGKIIGVVTDDEGTPLPGVTVEATSINLMGKAVAITNDMGHFRLISLPPGTYTITFTIPGFANLVRKGIVVQVGKTFDLRITMTPAALEEEVTVTAESPVVDVTKSSMTTTFDKDLLEKIPSGRFTFLDIVKQAPGIQQVGQDSDRNVAFGSNMESNAYYLDGVDISNPEIGIVWHWINADAFEEVETSGIGSPAEYGQFTGAVVNIVTKSGGNKFNGSISYYGQFDALTDDNNPKEVLDPSIPVEESYLYPDQAYSYHRDAFYYLTFNLGGPIIKDRLWFFASYEKSKDSVSFWNSSPDYPTTWPADKYFLKLSAQVASKHKLVGSFYYEIWEDPDSIDPWTEKEALGNEVGTTPTWNLLYTWLISNNAYFELKYSGYVGDDDYEPMHSDLNTPGRWDGYYGVSSEGLWWPWYYKVTRHQANANLSYFAEDFIGGDHDFKIGAQYNRGTSDCHGGYAGGRAYYDYYGYPYYMYEQDVFGYGGVVNSIAAFVDDTWKIGDRLTLNLGFRFDYSKASIPSYPVYDGWNETGAMTDPVDDLITWNTFSPRIGLAFQLTSDQKTLLKASYGRYYDALHIANWEWPGPNVTDWYMYWWDWETEEWILWDYLPGEMDYTVDPDLKNPYADQFSIGLEREIFPDFSVGATFIYKKEKNLIGWEDRGATYQQVNMVSPDNEQTYTVWNQTSDLGTNDYWITNPKDYEQTYWGAILTLTKRYSRNWMLNASLSWSKNEGLNMMGHSSWQQAMIWYAGDYAKDPNDLINAKGLLANDRTWVIKVQAGYTFPWEILASINYIYQTGRPEMQFVRVYGLNQDFGAGRRILGEPRSSDSRLPDWSMLDFRLQKTFNFYKTLKLHAIFDVFNVFNSNTTTYYASWNTWADNYLELESIFYPRRVQIGVKLEF